MELKPLFARVILDRPRKEKIGNIILPETVQRANASLKCRVLSAGPTCEPEIKGLIGKFVLIGKHAGAWLDKDGNPVPHDNDGAGAMFFIVEEQDILAEVAGD